MPLPLPNLDDRTFDDLINDAKRKIAQITQDEWTDFSPSDPGWLLLELYAYLTETMIYRINRLPQKVYVALLNLLGVTLRPQSAANVTLEFTLDPTAVKNETIPRGTRIASKRVDASGQPVVFRTAQDLIIPAEHTTGRVLAYHYDPVEGELLGFGTGIPGSTFKVDAPPIVNPPGEFENALSVWVEASPNQSPTAMTEREFNGKTFQLWRQVDNFTGLNSYPYVYVVDRIAGTITFAPGQGWENYLPPAVPAAGRNILSWYWHGSLPDSSLLEPAQSSGSGDETYGKGTGKTDQKLELTKPIMGQTLRLAVQAETGEPVEPGAKHQADGQIYRVWSQVDDLSQLHPSEYVYRLDPISGIIYFASEYELKRAQARFEKRQAHIPPNGREIRARYWRGGGSAGNVDADSLTELKDPLPDVKLTVTNPFPASGGYDAETIEQAMQRGPQELYSLPRGAITARDFERVALRNSPAIVRAKALTLADLWEQASPGTVEVLLVPDLPEVPKAQRGNGQVTAEKLKLQETPDTRQDCITSLEALRPLGTHCQVNWTKYKKVRVRARIVVSSEENAVMVCERVTRRLHEHINPLPTAAGEGWPFGKELRVSDVYNIALAEPGVRWVDGVRLVLDEIPEKKVCTLAADHFQPGTWYAGSNNILFRTRNDGEGWEPAAPFPGEIIRIVRTHPKKAGHIIVLTHLEEGSQCLHLSEDYGENWKCFTPRDKNRNEIDKNGNEIKDINGMVWGLGETLSVLLATDSGLFRFDLQSADETAVLVPLDSSEENKPVYAVAATRTFDSWQVAAVTQQGVYISKNGVNGFLRHNQGLRGGEDIQELAFQKSTYLWAGTAAASGQKGQGCLRLQLGGGEEESRESLGTERGSQGGRAGKEEAWEFFGPERGWKGGSCNFLAFVGDHVLAATHHQGVLALDTSIQGSRWKVPDVATCGLPPRSEPGPFQPVASLATNNNPEKPVIMAGVVREIERQEGEGVYRSRDLGRKYEYLSQREFAERVTLPPDWLFVSGPHEVIIAEEGQEVS
jgi:hypothetical protein